MEAETINPVGWAPACRTVGPNAFGLCNDSTIEMVAFSGRVAAVPRSRIRAQTGLGILPSAAPLAGPATQGAMAPVEQLNAAQGLARRTGLAVGQGVTALQAALAGIRPEPWRTGYDASGWRLSGSRLVQMTPVGGTGTRIRMSVPWAKGLPSSAMAVHLNAGFDGLSVPDFAFPPAVAARFLVASQYHGPLARVRFWWGTALVPMPVHVDEASIPRLFPVARAGTAGPQLRLLPSLLTPGQTPPLPGGGAPQIAPVPLPLTAPAFAAVLGALGALASRRRR